MILYRHVRNGDKLKIKLDKFKQTQEQWKWIENKIR